MKIIRQRNSGCQVEKLDSKRSRCSAFCIATDFEGSAWIEFLNESYEITDARWCIHRGGETAGTGEGDAPLLKGDSAYPMDRRNHVKVLPDYSCPGNSAPSPEWEEVRELFRETMRGAMQAETYLYRERGYGNVYTLEELWTTDCRPYTLDPPSTRAWPAYIHSDRYCREHNLYNKNQHSMVLEEGSGKLTAIGTYSDSFHEMSVTMELDPEDLSIGDMQFQPIRVPFPKCHEFGKEFAGRFRGLQADRLSKKDVAALLGGPLGCFHYVDLVSDMCKAAAGCGRSTAGR